ncbi:MAG: cytochrome C [Deltaproteobacteria bacterium CG23_combo_of_CG06-09_8_20_14_all_51_20]|nr:MAG: cytochrome C [Deltaproteobacteria bacterium CG23_combo_of_CG06-09_8_20_14_all_51_20]
MSCLLIGRSDKMLKSIAILICFGIMWVSCFAAGGEAQERNVLYVGSEACKECHDAQFKSFMANSKKAGSFANILRMQKKLSDSEFRDCFKCHTTGYGEPGGFRSAEKTPHLKNPGCEVCHGAGSIHAESGDPSDLKVKVSLKVCNRCHNSERVAAFGFKPILYSGGH